jgi:MATE family multidrug resistance protein
MSDTTTPSTVMPVALVREALPSLREETRRLLVLAAPTIGVMISRMAIGFTDFIFVSQLGTDATAAISPATILVFGVVCLGMGVSMSIQTYAAQSYGRRRFRDTSAYAWQGFYVAAVFLLLTPLASWLADPFWRLVKHTPEVTEMRIAFCRIAFWCMAFSIICSSLDGFFNAVRRPSVGLMAILVAVAFNVVANYALVFGKLGFPAMGIRGSAIATVCSWGIRAVLLTLVFLSAEFKRAYATHETWRIDWSKIAAVVRLGGPIAVQLVLDIWSWWFFLTLLMGRFGTDTMAASNISFQLMYASFMPAIGLAIALCSLIGHAIGEGKPDLAARRARVGMLCAGAYMGTIGIVFWLAREPLMRLWSSDPEVVRLGSAVLVWAAIFQVFDAAQIVYVNALRGAGDTRWPAVVVAAHCWIVFIGGGYLVARLKPEWGLNGPWMMCTLYIILLGLALWRRFAREGWRKIDIFKEKPTSEPCPAA